MPNLNEVFGVSNTVPKYTYVDRDNLDSRFNYLIGTERHIVIYGVSKQGKTVLRRKNLPDSQMIELQCRHRTTTRELYSQILAQLGSVIPSEISGSMHVGAEVGGKVGIPLVTEGEGKVQGEISVSSSVSPVGLDSNQLNFIADEIRKSGRRVVVEDFHYLAEEEKKSLAYDLKAFYDLGVFFIIVGVWAEQNLLTTYNGDLSGRIEEIDVEWSDGDLAQVIRKGESALNITFDNVIRLDLIADAKGNVGLLQRLLEKYCLIQGIITDQETRSVLDDSGAVEQARMEITSEQHARYGNFFTMIIEGMRDSELRMYEHIVRVCVERADDNELVRGLTRRQIQERIVDFQPSARQSDVTSALQRINRLQADRNVSPLIFYYNDVTRRLQIVDRELLFYRRYKTNVWPWEDSDE